MKYLCAWNLSVDGIENADPRQLGFLQHVPKNSLKNASSQLGNNLKLSARRTHSLPEFVCENQGCQQLPLSFQDWHPEIFSSIHYKKKMDSDFIAEMYRLHKYWFFFFSYGGNLLCFLVSSLLRKDWSVFGPFPGKGENSTKSSIHFYRWPH